MSRVQTFILAWLGLIIILLLVIASVVLVWDEFGPVADDPATTDNAIAVVEATAIPATATLPASDDAVSATQILPEPLIVALPTDTPPPTNTPTDTPIPTNTPIPASTTPEPTTTNTPAPTSVAPTNTPVPPTSTPVPTDPPADTRGLVLNGFSIEGNGSYSTSELIWFNFNLGNTTGSNVPFGAIGVIPVKDGVTRWDLYHDSWSDQVVQPSGMVWRDNISELQSEPGSYTLQLGICFDATFDTCKNGGGNWTILGSAQATVN